MVPEVNIVLVCPGQPCLGRLDHCAMFFVKVKRTNPRKGVFLVGGAGYLLPNAPLDRSFFFGLIDHLHCLPSVTRPR